MQLTANKLNLNKFFNSWSNENQWKYLFTSLASTKKGKWRISTFWSLMKNHTAFADLSAISLFFWKPWSFGGMPDDTIFLRRGESPGRSNWPSHVTNHATRRIPPTPGRINSPSAAVRPIFVAAGTRMSVVHGKKQASVSQMTNITFRIWVLQGD